MRHKQLPTKSSRHKSLTFIIDSHTSFGSQQQQQQVADAATGQLQQQPSAAPGTQTRVAHKQSSGAAARPSQASSRRFSAAPTQSSSSLLLQQACMGLTGAQQAPGSRSTRPTATANATTTRAPIAYQKPSQQVAVAVKQPARATRPAGAGAKRSAPQTAPSGPLMGSTNKHRQPPVEHHLEDAADLLEPTDQDHQYEHNDEHMRHMSSVMRLAFLENNDIPLDDCSGLDFNSMSTASLLQRNIQQQLLHERRDQLKLQLKQQQLLFQQQQQHNYHKQQQQLKQLQQQQLRQQKQQQQLLQQQQQLKQQLEFNKHHFSSPSVHLNESRQAAAAPAPANHDRLNNSSSLHHLQHENHHRRPRYHVMMLPEDQDVDDEEDDDVGPVADQDLVDDDVDQDEEEDDYVEPDDLADHDYVQHDNRRRRQQQQVVQPDELDDDQDYYDVSESTIFATAANPISSSSSTAASAHNGPVHHLHQQQGSMKNLSAMGKCSTPKTNNGRGQARTPKQTARKKRASPKENPNNNNNNNNPMDQQQASVVYPKLNAQVDTSCGGFLCDEQGCGKSFPSIRKLRHHKVVHSDEFPFVCEFNGCGKKFKRKFGIDLHSTTHFDLDPHMYKKTSNHSSLPFFGRRMQYSMCKPCGQKFKTVHEYQYHMLKHGKEPFRCPVKGCGQTFGIWKSFQKHRASHYFNYFCKMDALCDHQTSNLQLLKLHIYCCHFRRKLPETSTMAATRGEHEENSISGEEDDDIDIMDEEGDDGGEIDADGDHELEPESAELDDPDSHNPQAQDTSMEEEEQEQEQHQQQQHQQQQQQQQVEHEDKSSLITIKHESPSIQESPIETEQSGTLRRDCRLRRNPPRSTTFGQDYATINNGGYTKPTLTSSPGQSKGTRIQIQLCSGGRSSVVKKKENSSNKCKLK